MTFPFKEIVKDERTKTRTFKSDVSNDELVWHRDRKDRQVKIIQSQGWFFQSEDELPVSLKPGDVVVIPKETWHRVIRRNNSGDLVVEINED